MKLAPENLLCLENTHIELPQTIPSDKNSLSCAVSMENIGLCVKIFCKIFFAKYEQAKISRIKRSFWGESTDTRFLNPSNG